MDYTTEKCVRMSSNAGVQMSGGGGEDDGARAGARDVLIESSTRNSAEVLVNALLGGPPTSTTQSKPNETPAKPTMPSNDATHTPSAEDTNQPHSGCLASGDKRGTAKSVRYGPAMFEEYVMPGFH